MNRGRGNAAFKQQNRALYFLWHSKQFQTCQKQTKRQLWSSFLIFRPCAILFIYQYSSAFILFFIYLICLFKRPLFSWWGNTEAQLQLLSALPSLLSLFTATVSLGYLLPFLVEHALQFCSFNLHKIVLKKNYLAVCSASVRTPYGRICLG